ncbi:hypothetical protein SIN8267_01153 [Sinobacterium norvegicum]|uniref:Lipoprotein n=1 Tax=Sinobacterium norvegicum TaxID=1641715 RepID=A0ABM9AD06_9GAMM|nr:hypothetical protein [Sinobacterium norvegicum]CAH0991052.1 hypothetical protein SIN8267_01153 [Sinobacterium norvegicum]
MKPKHGIILLVFTLGGCAQWFPAHVDEYQPGEYRLTAYGNSFAKRQELQHKFDREAAKICGDEAYVYLDPGRVEWQESETSI